VRTLFLGRVIGRLLCDIGLPEYLMPPIEETVESPLVYSYRTKITPHFERPPKHIKPYDVQSVYPDWLKIGFNIANNNSTMDIEVSLARISGRRIPNVFRNALSQRLFSTKDTNLTV
jgi:hypothetical protein